MLKGHF